MGVQWIRDRGLTLLLMAMFLLFLTRRERVHTRRGRGRVPAADPYHILRVEPHRDFDVIVFGGEDHKTGQQDDTVRCYQRLEERLTAMVPRIDVTHRWSGQVIETPDGLPYIGQTADHQYAATGYAGNGLTFGTLAGMMTSDAILERTNPWRDLFHPCRKAITHGVWDYLKENVDYPDHLIRDRFAGADAQSLRVVKRGQGKIIERNGSKVAAYRDPSGAVTFARRSAPTWGASWGGTPPNARGIARVMDRGSSQPVT